MAGDSQGRSGDSRSRPSDGRYKLYELRTIPEQIIQFGNSADPVEEVEPLIETAN